MKEKFETFLTWIKGNKIIAAIGGIIVLMFLYKKFAKKTYRRRRRSLPRSVNYPVRRRRTTASSRGKKAWQVKGSMAAKRRMALLRRKRNRKFL